MRSVSCFLYFSNTAFYFRLTKLIRFIFLGSPRSFESLTLFITRVWKINSDSKDWQLVISIITRSNHLELRHWQKRWTIWTMLTSVSTWTKTNLSSLQDTTKWFFHISNFTNWFCKIKDLRGEKKNWRIEKQHFMLQWSDTDESFCLNWWPLTFPVFNCKRETNDSA